MGHSEMLLAVAGLEQDEIEARAAQLADGDWSEFSPAERVAFGFAQRLTAEPWSIDDGDVELLVETFGRARALDIVWHVAWGNYMTRVADAFQLQLESTNVFAPAGPPPR
jgi:alkylhydroperoxidase family enzyme